MASKITIITSTGVNCYLVSTSDGGFVLIDSGFSMGRSRVVNELESAGCQPGKLNLILITHADSDHTGNAALLRRKYAAKIAMHPAEVKAAESGNMLDSRQPQPFLTRLIFSMSRLGKSDRFTPDFTVEDGQELTPYGLEARVVHLPGHTAGEIGVLTGQGDLFCGDMFMHNDKGLRFGYGDPSDFKASLEKLKTLEINTFYPGHGKPFSGKEFLEFYQSVGQGS
jgi:glyoxylase-like metal-dependent hydrolase (beta-lactamase superfamily II)